MPIPNISRDSRTINISTTYSLTDPDISQVIADCTSAGFTLTIYDDLDSGAYHRLVVAISPNDSSGNTLTIVNAGATFSTSLDATSEAVELETTSDGSWIIAAQFSTTQAATASSKADSAGLRASSATSAATSNSLIISQTGSNATSAATSNSLIISQTGSTATSQNSSQSLNVSSTGSVAASAVLSGVSATASVATSQNASQSLNVSTAQSTAAS